MSDGPYGSARIIRAAETGTVAPLMPPAVSDESYRRIAREEVEAHLAAERIEQQARARAAAILEQAQREATAAGEQAQRQAVEHATTQAIAQWAAVRRAEDARLEQGAERVVMLAVALAERLVGGALELAPERIVTLARGVLAEARGARRAKLEAHPSDAAALRERIATLGVDPATFDIRDDPSLARGALRLHTDVGILDAQLTPRLERLAVALAEALAHGKP